MVQDASLHAKAEQSQLLLVALCDGDLNDFNARTMEPPTIAA
jgi:hypothetical protein